MEGSTRLDLVKELGMLDIFCRGGEGEKVRDLGSEGVGFPLRVGWFMGVGLGWRGGGGFRGSFEVFDKGRRVVLDLNKSPRFRVRVEVYDKGRRVILDLNKRPRFRVSFKFFD